MVAPNRAWLRSAASSARAALTAAALTLMIGFGAVSVLTAPQPPAERIDLSNDGMSRILERNHCSTTGFAPEVIPASAVIVDSRGRTRLVSFDHGWAVFNKERPGLLVAVCLGKPDRPGKVVQVRG